MDTNKSLIIFITLALCLQIEISCQNNEDIDVYIKSNSSIMENSEELIDTNCRLFVFSESHWWPVNYEIIFFHLKLLYEKAKVRTIFIELPCFVGVYYNYLLENPLVNIDSFALQSFDYYMLRKDSREIFQQFRVYYQTLPSGEKFKFIGIDFMFKSQIPHLFFALEMLLPKNPPPEKIENYVESIHKINTVPTSTNNYWQLLDTLFLSLQVNQELYREYLGANYEDYENLLFNGIDSKNLWHIKYSNYCDYDEKTIDKREEFLYQNITKHINKHENEGFIALLGNFHAYLTEQQYWCGIFNKKRTFNCVVSKLNQNQSSPIKGNIVIFRIYYSFKSIINTEQTEKTISRIVKKIFSDGNIYTLKLGGEKSPFLDVANKQYQYIIFVSKDK